MRAIYSKVVYNDLSEHDLVLFERDEDFFRLNFNKKKGNVFACYTIKQYFGIFVEFEEAFKILSKNDTVKNYIFILEGNRREIQNKFNEINLLREII